MLKGEYDMHDDTLLLDEHITNSDEIYTRSHRLFQSTLKKFVRDINLPSSIHNLIYFHLYPDNRILEIPFVFHERLFEIPWEDFDNIFLSYENLKHMPYQFDIGFRDAVYASLSGEYTPDKKCVDHMLLREDWSNLPWHLKHHQDGAISWFCIDVPKSEYVKYHGGNTLDIMQLLHKKITHFLRDAAFNNKRSYFSYQLPSVPTVITDDFLMHTEEFTVFKHFTMAENRCFLAIYDRHYETKLIAQYIGRSPRTVEGLINSMVAKTHSLNRYDLYIKISNAHNYKNHIYQYFSQNISLSDL